MKVYASSSIRSTQTVRTEGFSVGTILPRFQRTQKTVVSIISTFYSKKSQQMLETISDTSKFLNKRFLKHATINYHQICLNFAVTKKWKTSGKNYTIMTIRLSMRIRAGYHRLKKRVQLSQWKGAQLLQSSNLFPSLKKNTNSPNKTHSPNIQMNVSVSNLFTYHTSFGCTFNKICFNFLLIIAELLLQTI